MYLLCLKKERNIRKQREKAGIVLWESCTKMVILRNFQGYL